MTRPAPAPRMRIVPEVASASMCDIAADDITELWAGLLATCPMEGLVSREMVERAAIARHNQWMAEIPAFGAERKPLAWEQMPEKARAAAMRCEEAAMRCEEAAIAALGLTVAPAADTARNGEAE